MTDCATGGYMLPALPMRGQSQVFDAIYNQVTRTSYETSLAERSEIPQLDLEPITNLDLSDMLRQGQYNPPEVPAGAFTPPALEGITYEAANSLISFIHNSPLLSDISYIEPLERVPLPDVSAGPAPMGYPQHGPVTAPSPPTGLLTEAPVFELGEKPELVVVRPVEFEGSGITPVDLDELVPVYEPPEVDALGWQDELTYAEDLVLRTKLEELAGGRDEIDEWLAPAVQERFQKSEIRELVVRTKAELDQIMTGTAAKGFSLPTGPAEEASQRVAQRELEDAYKAANRVRDEIFNAAMNTLTRAIQQSIAVERYHFALYLRYVRQNLRVYQLNLSIAEVAYQSMVEVYGRLEQIINTKIDAYNQYLSVINAENQGVVASLAFTEAQLDRYRAQVDMYEADVRLTAESAKVRRDDVRQQTFAVDVYQSQLREAQANMAIIGTNLDGFREAIRAYRQQGDWYDTALGAFASSIEATASKTSVDSAKFDAYRRLWGAERTRSGAYREYVQSTTSAMDAEMRTYRQATAAQRQYLQEVVRNLDRSLPVIGAYAGLMQDFAQHARGLNTADISYVSARNDLAVADSTTQMVVDSLAAEAESFETRLDAAWAAAEVNAAGALAQAASAIYQVGVSASGSATDRVVGRESLAIRNSLQSRKSYSKVCTYVERPLTT